MATLLIVTGTGRSGTKYTANLLGIGHERHFTSDGIKHPLGHDASVVAHRYIDMPFAAHWYVIHQVRDPRTCIPSLARGPVFAMTPPHDDHWSMPYRSWCQNQWPEVYGQPTPLKRATWWWYCVNSHSEQHADETVRVEDIDHSHVERWAAVLDTDPTPIHQRLALLPKNVNARDPNQPLEWDSLPVEVSDLAHRYGYGP